MDQATGGSRQWFHAKNAPSLGVTLERLSRRVHIAKLTAKTVRALRRSLNRRLGRHPGHMRKTITYDNGSENVEHKLVNKILGIQSYFCGPYHSWEKGSVEPANDLIRRFLPKKIDCAKITQNNSNRWKIYPARKPRHLWWGDVINRISSLLRAGSKSCPF